MKKIVTATKTELGQTQISTVLVKEEEDEETALGQESQIQQINVNSIDQTDLE